MARLSDRPAGRKRPAGDDTADVRESLCNDRGVGPLGLVSLPLECVTRLHGLMVDLDPGLLRPENPLFTPADDPREFLTRVGPALDRHELLRDAEVRSSGRGLHALLWFSPPVELASAADQQRWSVLVRAVQCSLPSDPNAPGITALTRPVGSVNGKNGAVVEALRPGRPVEPARVEAFVRGLAAAPFRGVAAVLIGGDRAEPCPVCREPGSLLGVLDRCGKCYVCGAVSLDRLFEVVYRSVEAEDGVTEVAGQEGPPWSPVAAPKRGRRSQLPGPRAHKNAAHAADGGLTPASSTSRTSPST
jgi:hypothetical protein